VSVAGRSVQLRVQVVNEKGLHLKPAQAVVNVASRFASEILLGRDGQMVDAKSTLGLLALGAAPGAELELEIIGDDAEAAAEAMVRLFAAGFEVERTPGEGSGG